MKRSILVPETTMQGPWGGRVWMALRFDSNRVSGEVVPESWTGRIVNPESETRSLCPRNDVSDVIPEIRAA